MLLAGAEPESVTRVVVDDIQPGQLTKQEKNKWGTITNFKTTRTRVAERVSWDEVRMTVTEDGKAPYSNLYRIKPDGSFELISTEVIKVP